MNKKCVLGVVGYVILTIGGVLSSDSEILKTENYIPSTEKSSTYVGSDFESSSGEDLHGILTDAEGSSSSESSSYSNIESSKSQSTHDDDFTSSGGEQSEGQMSSIAQDLTAEGSVPQPNLSEFTVQSAETSKPEERSSKMEFVITKSGELAIENLFPHLESASILTVNDISKYPSVELKDEKVLESQLNKRINYYKVEPPMTHDTISGLSTNDPRVEIGVKSKFELLVDENQPRMERILRFFNSNQVNLPSQEKIDLSVLLFSVVTYGECVKKLKGINSSIDIAEICSQLTREDILTIQPEDLPKNVLKEKVELFKLTGTVLSIPLPLFTEASKMKWRHVPNPNGIYQVYNSGAIDGFAHFSFLYKKLYDITSFLHFPTFQFMDDVRIEMFNGIKGIKAQLGNGEQSRRVKKDISSLMDFYDNWFKGPKSKRVCSQDFFNAIVAMAPIYDAIHEMNKILKSIQSEFYANPSGIEEEFAGIPKQVIMNIHNNERKFFSSNVLPIFTTLNDGIQGGQVKVLRAEILRILAILEEIEFNSKEVSKALQDLQECNKMSSNAFKHELRYIKRDYYKLVKTIRKSNPKFPLPSPSSPLYIKGRKFGIRNLFKKNSARAKLGYYREFQPFNKSTKNSKK